MPVFLPLSIVFFEFLSFWVSNLIFCFRINLFVHRKFSALSIFRLFDEILCRIEVFPSLTQNLFKFRPKWLLKKSKNKNMYHLIQTHKSQNLILYFYFQFRNSWKYSTQLRTFANAIATIYNVTCLLAVWIYLHSKQLFSHFLLKH